MKIKRTPVLGIALWVLAAASGAGGAEESAIDVEAYNQCLLEKMRTAADETSVSELREACLVESQQPDTGEVAVSDTAPAEGDETTPLEARIDETRPTEQMRFVITPFKPNYIMVGYNHQSNGRNDPLSRSWNRLFANFLVERGKFAHGYARITSNPPAT